MIGLLAAIAFVGAGAKDCTTFPAAGVTSCVISYTSTGGNSLCVLTSVDTGVGDVSSVTASGGGGAFTQKVSADDPADATRGALWCATGVNASTTVTVNVTAAMQFLGGIVGEYSGAAAFGNTGSKSNDPAVTTHGPLFVTVQASNNFMVGGWAMGSSNLLTITTGTARCNLRGLGVACVAGTSTVLSLADNTRASPGVSSIDATSASERSAGVAVELCQANPCVAAGGATPIYGRRGTRGAGQ